MPAGHEVAERDDPRILGEHAEGADREHIGAGKGSGHPHIVLLRTLSGHDLPVSPTVLEEPERTAVRPSPPLQELVGHDGPPMLLVQFNVVGDQRIPGLFAVLQLDDDWTLAVPAPQLPEPAASVPGPPDPIGQALRQEREHVEDGGLPAAVRTEEDRERRQVRERDIAQSAVVLHAERSDARRRSGVHVGLRAMGHR